MKAPNLVLRCYARQEDGVWVTVCVDLCLAAQGATFLEAKAKLEAQVADYVEEALTVDKESAAELLTRRAPLSQRMEYWFIVLMTKLHLLRRRIGRAFSTILPVHVRNDCHA